MSCQDSCVFTMAFQILLAQQGPQLIEKKTGKKTYSKCARELGVNAKSNDLDPVFQTAFCH